jgi:hypothetical protein
MLAFNETHCREDLFPLTLTRPVADIRVGMLTIREKWRYSGLKISDEIPANLIPSPAFLQEVKILGLKESTGSKRTLPQIQFSLGAPGT